MIVAFGFALAAVLVTAAFFMIRTRRNSRRKARPTDLRLGDLWRFNGRVAEVRHGRRPGVYDATVELPLSTVRHNWAGAWVDSPTVEFQDISPQPAPGQICRVEAEIVALSSDREEGVTLRFSDDSEFATSRRQVLKYGRKALIQPTYVVLERRVA